MKRTPPTNGPIGRKLVAEIRRALPARVVDLNAFAAARDNAAELRGDVRMPAHLAEYDPVHAVWIMMQNQASILSEIFTGSSALGPIADIVAAAEDEFVPSGPPMSPLTTSYFTMWAMFDAWVGPRRETIGTCMLDAADEIEMDPEFKRLLEMMQQSRMGLYANEGRDGRVYKLREIVTGDVGRFIVPTGYAGRRGEVWLARTLPAPRPSFDYGVVFTTPYVFVKTAQADWLAYFERQKAADRAGYETLMKWGWTTNYWNEYIFEAYSDHQFEAVFLRGIPDVPGSRPHEM